MPEPFVRNARTGQPPDPAMLRLLCDGDRSAYLTDCGLDIRPYFDAVRSTPVTLHIVNHSYQAAMYRPTRRERLRGWWYTHRWPLVRGLVIALNLLALYVALNLVMAGANMLADWLSALW